MTTPKYLVNRRDDGTIRIMLSSGEDCTAVDVDFIRRSLAYALRAEAMLANTPHTQIEFITEGNAEGVRFPVDAIVVDLERERKRRGLKRIAVARAMFIQASKLSDYVTGRSRPLMDTQRNWAYVLQHKLLLVPMALLDELEQMIQAWRKADDEQRKALEARS